MAARQLRKQEVADAVKTFVELHPELTASSNEKGFCLMPGDILVGCEDGKLVCNDPSIREKLIEIIVMSADTAPQEPAIGTQNEDRPARPNVPAVPRNGQDRSKTGQSFDVDAWRGKQDRTYSVAGKTAPNAFAASEEANRRGLCTQIMDSGRTHDLVWGHVRVLEPKTGQYREDRVSHERSTFCLLKAWEDANSQARYQKPGQPQLIIGVSDDNMPILNPDVKIKGMSASLWLTMSVMRSWSFADRDAITKAERRAQLKILNREWREDGEIDLELEEEKAVQEAIGRKG